MSDEQKLLFLEIERILKTFPDVRIGELLSIVIKPEEDLLYIDDNDLIMRVQQISEQHLVRNQEDIINKRIYDMARDNSCVLHKEQREVNIG